MIAAALHRLYIDALKYHLELISYKQGNTVMVENEYITAVLRPENQIIYAKEQARVYEAREETRAFVMRIDE